MKQKNDLRTANLFRNIARYSLLTIGLLVFFAALVFGAEGGIKGIIKNSPNALPWLVLLLAILMAWKWELLGGIIVTILGVGLLYFFNFSGPNFWWSTFLLTLSIPLLSTFFILSWYLRRGTDE